MVKGTVMGSREMGPEKLTSTGVAEEVAGRPRASMGRIDK